MEKTIITLITCWFTYCVFMELFNLINNLKCYFIEFTKVDNNKYMTLDDYDHVCKEITLLKSLHLMNKRAIRNIIRRLPFKGEAWEQEFINEELEELEKSGYYENLERSVLCDGNGPVEPIL